jgi:Leucine-rich repeat (LRR) protein
MVALNILGGSDYGQAQEAGSAESQRDVIAPLAAAGATFRFAEGRPGKPVISVTIRGDDASDSTIARLMPFTRIESLTLVDYYHRKSRVTDAGAARLWELKNLRSLQLQSSKLTDVGMVELGKLAQLEDLTVGNGAYTAEITNTGLAQLKGLSNLRSLTLEGTRITDSGMSVLRAFGKLRHVGLTLIDGGLSEHCLIELRGMRSLQSLSLIDFRSGAKSVDSSLLNITALPRLESLEISSLRVTDAGLVHLGAAAHLKRLKLHHSLAPMPVDDQGIQHLVHLKQLEYLDVRGTRVTSDGVQRLRRMLPNAKVDGPE